MTPDELFAEGWRFHQAGDFRQAEERYRRILQTSPRNGRTWFVLGNLCAAENRLAEAAACIRQALEFEPREAMGWVHLGNVLLRQEKYAEAEEAYRKCLDLQPRHVEALVHRGFALAELERLDEAKACYEQARTLDPKLPEVHHNLGNVLRDQGELDAALACYDEALRLRPDYGKAHVNKGVALVARGALDAALESLRRGVELQPNFAEAHNSLGTALSARGRLDEAIAEYETAIRIKPTYADAQWNRALVRLLQGDYERGWPDYEWRWKCKKAFPLPPMPRPRWDGGSLEGRTILLYAEQGLGDTLQFIRYAPLVKAKGGHVVVQCQGSLVPLLSRCAGIDTLLPWGALPPAFDVYAALLSLPALLGTTLETIPNEVPYLHADPALVEHWRRQLAIVAGFKIGIAWQGSIRHAWDRHRSVPLADFAPLAAVPGVRLISLQKGPGSEQTQGPLPFSIADFGDLVDRTGGAFMDAAAILPHLDLVVSVDTAVAHLAGALGAPVWLALHHTPDWRWLLGRADSPWYPTARLFRQPAPGEWVPVFREMAEALRSGEPGRVSARSSEPGPLLVEVSAGELLDKLSILRIKNQRIADPDKRRHVQKEMAALETARRGLPAPPGLAPLEAELEAVNAQLWEVEDALRICEREQNFGPRFVELARSVYHTNDRRAALKRAVNDLLGSPLVEVKSYAAMDDRPGAEQTANR